jgi:hypothetical protein
MTCPAGVNGPATCTPTSTFGTSSRYSMMFCPSWAAPPSRTNAYTWSRSRTQIRGNSCQVAACATTAVGHAATVCKLTS